MNLNKTILVNQGQAMITEAINLAQPIILTKFTIGKGTVATENAALALTNVVSAHRDVPIANNTQEGNIYKCTCYYDNKTEPADVTIKEIGLYGKVGTAGVVKLFAYVTFEPGDYLPIGGGSVYSEYSKILNVGITELATVESVVNIIVEKATKTSLGVVQIGNGVAVNTNGVISLGTANDGLIINANDIKLDTVNTLVSTSITKPLSAAQGKALQDNKVDKTIQVVAGNGLSGGGALSSNSTLNIVSNNDGIVVNLDDIKLDTQNILTSTSTTKPLSANMGKQLQDTKADKTTVDSTYVKKSGDTMTGVLTGTDCRMSGNVVGYNVCGSNENNINSSIMLLTGTAQSQLKVNLKKPSTGELSSKVLIGVDRETGNVWQTNTYFNEGLTGTTATFSGNVTAPNLAYDTTTITAGTGLTGGGDLSASRTLNIASANDGIIANADNIQLDTQNTLTSTSITKPLSAAQGKALQDNKVDKTIQVVAGNGLTGGGDLTTDRTLNIASANAGISINADNIELKPATSSSIGGVKVGESMTVSADGTINAILNQTIADGRYVNVTGDTMTGQLNGTTATFSGNVTAPRLIMTSAQATGDGDAVRYDFANSTYFTNNPKSIPANTNLNTFLTKGHYTSTDYSYTSTMSNTPFGATSFTLVVDGIGGRYYTQLATGYYNGIQSCRVTEDNGATWTDWTEIINKTTGDATYVKKYGDTMTGSLTATALAATNGTDTAAIIARYNNIATDQLYMYNNLNSAGIYSIMPTQGEFPIFSRSKSTGVVTYAGGNYGTIKGSTATFSGNVTAPSITIGGYVVTIV